MTTANTINCKGKLLSLDHPIVMGILNVTPDSFYDGGNYQHLDAILKQTEKMLNDGATIIDIGGMSSRPGAEIISVAEELKRVLPAIQKIHENFPEAILSIDTVRAKVAKEAVQAGVSIVNDISAGKIDENLYQTVANLGVPYILMHMKGKPKNMQNQPTYDDVVLEIMDFFIAEIGKLRALGIKDLILDPGFGFGKTIDHNFFTLKNLNIFKVLGLPVLAGISRKSMIYKYLKINSSEALNGTTALHMIALQQGAKILRAHDVKEAAEVIKLHHKLETVAD
jgi:dihydropteroate synthase